MKVYVFVVPSRYWDDGIYGVFSSKEKALEAFHKAYPNQPILLNLHINEYELDEFEKI